MVQRLDPMQRTAVLQPLHDDLAFGGDVAAEVPVHLGSPHTQQVVTDPDVLKPEVLVDRAGGRTSFDLRRGLRATRSRCQYPVRMRPRAWTLAEAPGSRTCTQCGRLRQKASRFSTSRTKSRPSPAAEGVSEAARSQAADPIGSARGRWGPAFDRASCGRRPGHAPRLPWVLQC